MKKFIKKIVSDKTTVYNLIIACLLVFLHSWQYVKSGYEIKPLINLVMTVLYIISTLLIGAESLPYFLLAYSFIYLPVEQFDNYTTLLLLLSAISLKKKLLVTFLPYSICLFVCYMMNGMEMSHIGISACYIAFFFNTYKAIREKHSEIKDLVLTDDEEEILNELCNGKEAKELDISEKTIYNKLRDARERNNCISNKELKSRYKACKRL